MFESIRRHGQIARVDVAQDTGVSPATVTAIVAEMIREGLVEERPQAGVEGVKKRGRPRVLLEVRGEAHLVAGLKIAHRSISAVITDFAGRQVAAQLEDLRKTEHEALELRDRCVDAVCRTAKTAGLNLSDLSAIGVGIAGLVDATRGFVHWSPSLSSRNVGIGVALAEAVGMPVFVDNDANLVAVAERLFGLGRDVENFLVVTVENGVGVGIVLDGKIYRGVRGCGAEFGHTKVQLDGALCRCGQRGCLEAYVGDYAMLREASVAYADGDQTIQASALKTLIADAKNGEQPAQTIVARAARMFGMGLANLVNLFDPELILLAGERVHLDQLYEDELLNSLKNLTVKVDAPLPKIIIHKWSDEMWAMGAAAFAISGVTDHSLQKSRADAA